MLAILLACLYLVHRLVDSRFGMVLRAAKSNEARTRAIGFSPYPYRLAAFVIAGAMCGLAGALFVNHTAYLTPEFMNWTRSGELMFMVILGGMATLSGRCSARPRCCCSRTCCTESLDRSTGRSSSARSSCWWCCSRSAAWRASAGRRRDD